jgi:hypothetical protein
MSEARFDESCGASPVGPGATTGSIFELDGRSFRDEGCGPRWRCLCSTLSPLLGIGG